MKRNWKNGQILEGESGVLVLGDESGATQLSKESHQQRAKGQNRVNGKRKLTPNPPPIPPINSAQN